MTYFYLSLNKTFVHLTLLMLGKKTQLHGGMVEAFVLEPIMFKKLVSICKYFQNLQG